MSSNISVKQINSKNEKRCVAVWEGGRPWKPGEGGGGGGGLLYKINT